MSISDQEFFAFMAEQRASYGRGLPPRLAQMAVLWRQSQEGQAPAAALARLEQLAHGLAGSGGTFGFVAVGDAARDLERRVQQLQAALPTDAPALRAETDRALQALLQSDLSAR